MIVKDSLIDRIMQKIVEAKDFHNRNRLIFLVGPAKSGKTSALQNIAISSSVPLININLELSKLMLNLNQQQQIHEMPSLLKNIINDKTRDIVLLDNIELLFDITYKQDPVRLLQGLSRDMTVVASFNGSISDDNIVYAIPNHSEYRRYSIQDFHVVDSKMAT